MKQLKNIICGAMLTACSPIFVNAQTAWSWGYNLHGELGNGTWGTGFSGSLPAKAGGTAADWKFIDAYGGTTLALKTDNSLWAWGGNLNGQIGDGTSVSSNMPKQTGTDKDWAAVSEGEYHAVGLKTDGTIWTWGSNSYGTLGNGTSTIGSTDLVPTKMGTDNNWAVIAAGQWFTIALKTDGTLWYWGHDNAGSSLIQSTPKQIGTDNDWKTIATGWNSHSIAIKKDGTMWAWGLNDRGQLGRGVTGFPDGVPTQIGTDNNWSSASVGHSYTLATKTDGTIWSWGWNDKGQLGDGTTTDSYAPAKVGTASDWKMATAGRKHSMAIKNDGTLWIWGWNNNYQLGDGTMVDTKSPKQVGVANDWEAVSGDELYTVALRKASLGVVSESKPGKSVLVYPNPASNTITITATGNTVTVVSDLAGKLLLTSSDKTIDISSLPNGVMVYKVVSGDTECGTGIFTKY